jgi:UDP-GlcNAc:undecaprenyl-phosphate GlcNAc-1-phosphate transferase
MQLSTMWLTILTATICSASLAWLLIPLAIKIGWVDRPGEHKIHESATPPVGGLAIFIVITIYFSFNADGGLLFDTFVRSLLAGGFLMLLLGLWDDMKGASQNLRLFLQMAVCLLMIFIGEVHLADFGSLFTSNVVMLGWLAIPITVFAALGVINSFNLIDGMDGLAGSIYLVAILGILFMAWGSGQDALLAFLLVSSAAVLGFLLLNARLPWNSRARVFLGNSGSLFMGFILAWCLIRAGNGPERLFMPMTAVWLFAVPLLDTATLIRRRWGDGRSAFSADRNHLHHAFLRAGFSVEQTWAAIILLAIGLALVGIGIELSALPEYVSFYSFMAIALVYYFYMKHCWASQRFLGRHFIHHDFQVEEGYA